MFQDIGHNGKYNDFEGFCQSCENYAALNDLSLCTECAEKLERDLIRQREWDYSISAFALDDQEREKLRQEILREYGEAYELIVPDNGA